MSKFNIFKEVSLYKVRLQMQSISELKTRAGVLLGFTIAFVGFVISNDIIRETINKSFINKVPIILISFSLYLFLLALVVRNFYFSPEPDSFYKKLGGKEEKEVIKHLIKDLNDDFKDNQKEINGLSKIINLGIFVDLIGITWLIFLLIPLP